MDKQRKLKVFHISNAKFDSISGISTVVPELIYSQNRTGKCEAVLIALKKHSNVFNFNTFLIHSVYQFIKLVKKENPDLFVFHDLYEKSYLLLSLIIFYYRKPFIIVPHGCFHKEAQKHKMIKKIIANHILWAPMIHLASAISYLSNEEKNNSIIKNKKSIVVPNGVNKINYTFKDNYSSDLTKIIYLGRFDIHHKGLDLMLLTFSKIKTELKERDVKLYLYGGSVKGGKETSSSELEKMIRKNNLDDLIVINAPVFGNEKELVLSKSDLIILTSRYEGMPMAILEALSFGIPAIVSKNTNMSGIVNDHQCGWVLSEDFNHWPFEILSAIDQYKKNKAFYITNSYKCASNFLWSKIGNDSVCEYLKVLQT